jgi:hypothetical protein
VYEKNSVALLVKDDEVVVVDGEDVRRMNASPPSVWVAEGYFTPDYMAIAVKLPEAYQARIWTRGAMADGTE